MGKFVYFTSAEKRQANEVDLPSFLLDRGEKLIMAGRDYRLVSDHSITVRRCGMTMPHGRADAPSASCSNSTTRPIPKR